MLMDVNLVEERGQILLSAQEYTTWWGTFRAVVAPLRVQVVGAHGCAKRLLASTAQSAERLLSSCKYEGCDPRDAPIAGSGDTNHKNPSFFAVGDELFILDWLHPTGVARVATLPQQSPSSAPQPASAFWSLSPPPRHCGDPQGETVSSTRNDSYALVAQLCINASTAELPASVQASVFERLASEPGTSSGESNNRVFSNAQKGGRGADLLHGGRQLVRMPEIGGELLGVGHISRGVAHTEAKTVNGNHYSHFFFTISGEPPFTLSRLSSEFCLASADRPADCESVQFSSSVLREADDARPGGERLRIGYGVSDLQSMTVTLPVEAVLTMLRKL